MTTLNDFEVLDKLGEGSFGTVYKVKRKSDGQYYAMKKVMISLQSFKERENTLNEVRILASLQTPQIIEYKECFLSEDSGTLYVIMEFATGGDLNNVLQKSKPKGLDEQEIWRVLVQLTLGLKILHVHDILHRDLKLANVFVAKTPEGNLYKIGDLNISKVTHGKNAKTQAGTPYYAAPEVWRGDQYSYQCDIWSLGCILYELAAQVPPFRAGDLQSLNKRIQAGRYDSLPARYSKDLSDVIADLLQVNPKKRPTCDTILKNPIVIKNSGSIVVEDQVGEKQNFKLLQTIKLPYNLKQLKGQLPQANYEKKERIQRSSSVEGIRKVADTPQPQKKQPDEPKAQFVQKPGLPPTPSQQLCKPPLLKPPQTPQMKPPQQPYAQQQQAQLAQKVQQQDPRLAANNQQIQQQAQLAQKVQQQEQRLLGNNQARPPVSYVQQVTPRAQSPRGGYRPAAGLPSAQSRRQYSAGPSYRK